MSEEVEQLLLELLAIPSPTGSEQAFVAWLKSSAALHLPHWSYREHSDSVILQAPWQDDLPHLALIGHSDVVPAHVVPYQEGDRLIGAGASDMKAALAAFWYALTQFGPSRRWNLSLVVYSREEQTPLPDNGLYHLLQAFPHYFRSVDLAIVGEPTDNTLQLGCLGGLHAQIQIQGQACHSARPWNGENALYKALPFIQAMADLPPLAHEIMGLTFYDVWQITESQSEPGRTSLPGWWKANLNYRFAPIRSLAEAKAELYARLADCGIEPEQIQIQDEAPPGAILKTPLLERVLTELGRPLSAKQAWTDVAQLTAHGIPAFNFGPGLTAQAHKTGEYVLFQDLLNYLEDLKRLW